MGEEKNDGVYFERKIMTGHEIRSEFLKFFREKEHEIVSSSSLLPGNDPTLLFTNAGMVPFKDVFLGKETRGYKRAATSQKCVRAGGKHNDLEEVGKTARHHTFFEMLGNFSFGDYFKERAIEYAWEFITEVLKIPENDLLVTVYKDDDEARRIWEDSIKVPSEKIISLGEKDNFWSMGETGPCGPCSEIHIDRGVNAGCGKPDCGVECECGRFMELWNLVFMQFNRDRNGKMTELPEPSIDTGMGLERLASVLQKTPGNYETDLLKPIIDFICDLTEKPYGAHEETDISLRVIADHARAATFLIGDGVLPSNEGRGYVLRRIIRRALRYGKLLARDKPFLYKVSGSVVELMKGPYPELKERMNTIAKIIIHEEERFINTLDYGLRILEDLISGLEAKGEKTISGEDAFKLYDTYGFPMDMTEDIGREKGLGVDRKGFEKAMTVQKERARASWKGSGESVVEPVYHELLKTVGNSEFVGYGATSFESELKAIVVKGREVTSASKGEAVELFFPRTPFYGESGGQVGDRGSIRKSGTLVEVAETRKILPQLVLHRGRVLQGTIRKGETMSLQADESSRSAIALNHTATHLLHAALRGVLGDHVKQAGSLVSEDRLRFDFTHFTGITSMENERIEEIVNQQILKNFPVETQEMAFEQAVENGAMALFGEKYGGTVRVVSIADFSSELCGGTHTKATGDIGMFKIIHEGSVAAGVRRIEALTGKKSYSYIKNNEKVLAKLCEVLKTQPDEMEEKIGRLFEKNKELEQNLNALKNKMLQEKAGEDLASIVKKVKGISVLAQVLENVDAKSLRSYIDTARNKLGSGLVVVGTVSNGKAALAAGATKDLLDQVHAGNILKEIAPLVGGRGGGRADMAQAGGKSGEKLKEAIESVYGVVERMVS